MFGTKFYCNIYTSKQTVHKKVQKITTKYLFADEKYLPYHSHIFNFVLASHLSGKCNFATCKM